MGHHAGPKYTPERLKRFADALRMGATYALACKYAGFSYNRYREWMIDAETNPDSPYRDLPELVAEAEGQASVKWLEVIEKAASDGDWKAAAWKLERRYAEDYARRSVVDAAMTHQVSHAMIRELAAEEARLIPAEALPALEDADLQVLDAANRDPGE
jgi:transposase